MKVKAIILALVVCCNALSDSEAENEWKQFQVKFQKSYRSPIETKKRYNIFKGNLLKIEAHNELFDQGKETYTQGITQFADLTADEFLDYVNKFKFVPSDIETSTIVLESNLSIPATVDWRQKNAVTKVKNQGQCGSCWSFSSTGALEGQAVIKKNQHLSLSEQDLVDCDLANKGCNGGNMGVAFNYVKSHGIDSEDHYPYEAKRGKCRHTRSVLKITGIGQLAPGEANLQGTVAQRGPISVMLEATSNLQHYRSGILYDSTCRKKYNHAVLAVGYGNQNGQDYWLIKNSWGATWGESGYFRLARNRGDNCGIADYGYLPLM